MTTDCRVWEIFQARCLLCDWNGEAGDRASASTDAQEHRASDEHKRKLKERRARGG